jgi:GTPase SAR1 family protein
MAEAKLRIKVVFFGPTGSGKTGLLQRITNNNTFTAELHQHTADIQIKTYSSQRSQIDYTR